MSSVPATLRYVIRFPWYTISMTASFDALKFTTDFGQYAIDVTQSGSIETLGGPGRPRFGGRYVSQLTHHGETTPLSVKATYRSTAHNNSVDSFDGTSIRCP